MVLKNVVLFSFISFSIALATTEGHMTIDQSDQDMQQRADSAFGFSCVTALNSEDSNDSELRSESVTFVYKDKDNPIEVVVNRYNSTVEIISKDERLNKRGNVVHLLFNDVSIAIKPLDNEKSPNDFITQMLKAGFEFLALADEGNTPYHASHFDTPD